MAADRIDLIVVLAVKNLQHPYKNSFPAFARAILTSKLSCSPATCTNEIKTLTSAWAADKWQAIIKNCSYQITPEEITLWEASWKPVSCTQ